MEGNERITGVWKGGNYVFRIPRKYWSVIREIRVTGALARVPDINPILFHVVIPEDVLEPDEWCVEVDVAHGVLHVKPLQEFEVPKGVMEPHIGVVLPRGIPIRDH